MVESLANTLVLERVLAFHAGIQQLITLLVHTQEDGAQLGTRDGARIGTGIHTGNVLHGYGLHHVNFAGQQRGHTGGVIGNRREHDVRRIALDRAPIGSVACKAGLHTGLAFAQAVGACAIGAERGRVFNALAAINRLGGLIRLAPLLAHDVEKGNHVRQDGKRCLGLDLHREVVDFSNLFNVIGVALHVGAVTRRARKTEYHVISSERRAIVKLHAFAEFKAPHVGRWLRPFGRQRGRQAEVLVAPNQAFIHVAGDAQLHGLVERMRVHRCGIALIGDAQGLRRCYKTHSCQCISNEGYGRIFLEKHHQLLLKKQNCHDAAIGMACSARLACRAEPSDKISSLKSYRLLCRKQLPTPFSSPCPIRM